MSTSGAIPPDVQEAVGELTNRYEKIRQSLMDEMDSHQHPSTIYHYTNDVGFKGMETGQLWLTDIFDLNDPSELKHGFSIMLGEELEQEPLVWSRRIEQPTSIHPGDRRAPPSPHT